MDLPATMDPIPVEYATFQALLARKYFIRGINYLDDRYGEFGADAELSYQIRRAGRTLAVLPDIQIMRSPSIAVSSKAAETLLAADRYSRNRRFSDQALRHVYRHFVSLGANT